MVVSGLGISTNEVCWCVVALLLEDFRANNLAADGFPQVSADWNGAEFSIRLALSGHRTGGLSVPASEAIRLVESFRNNKLNSKLEFPFFQKIQKLASEMEKIWGENASC